MNPNRKERYYWIDSRGPLHILMFGMEVIGRFHTFRKALDRKVIMETNTYESELDKIEKAIA